MKITDDLFKKLEADVHAAMAAKDIDKILDASLALLDGIANQLPGKLRDIRSAALEEAAMMLVDMAKENEIARDCFKALSEHEHSYRHEQYRKTILANAESIRALKDKPNE